MGMGWVLTVCRHPAETFTGTISLHPRGSPRWVVTLAYPFQEERTTDAKQMEDVSATENSMVKPQKMKHVISI